MGHWGIQETYQRMKDANISIHYDEVKNLVFNCPTCQMMQNKHSHRPVSTSIIKTSGPNQTVGADSFGPFQWQDRQFYIISIVDQFDKNIYLHLCNGNTAENFVNGIIRYISIYGIFDKLHTDQGSNFTSHVVKEVLQHLGIQHFLAAVARHQSCGAEGTNKQASRHRIPSCPVCIRDASSASYSFSSSFSSSSSCCSNGVVMMKVVLI